MAKSPDWGCGRQFSIRRTVYSVAVGQGSGWSQNPPRRYVSSGSSVLTQTFFGLAAVSCYHALCSWGIFHMVLACVGCLPTQKATTMVQTKKEQKTGSQPTGCHLQVGDPQKWAPCPIRSLARALERPTALQTNRASESKEKRGTALAGLCLAGLGWAWLGLLASGEAPWK